MDTPPRLRNDLINLECAGVALVHELGANGLRLALRSGAERLEELLRKKMELEALNPAPDSGLETARRLRLEEERARMSWDLLSDEQRDEFLAIISSIDPAARPAVQRALDPDRNRPEL